LELVQLRIGEGLVADLEALELAARGLAAAPLHDRARVVDELELGADAGDVLRLRGHERDLRAALEVDAEVQALDAERDRADENDHAREREPELALAHVVELEPLPALLRAGAHQLRV